LLSTLTPPLIPPLCFPFLSCFPVLPRFPSLPRFVRRPTRLDLFLSSVYQIGGRLLDLRFSPSHSPCSSVDLVPFFVSEITSFSHIIIQHCSFFFFSFTEMSQQPENSCTVPFSHSLSRREGTYIGSNTALHRGLSGYIYAFSLVHSFAQAAGLVTGRIGGNGISPHHILSRIRPLASPAQNYFSTCGPNVSSLRFLPASELRTLGDQDGPPTGSSLTQGQF